MTPRSERILRQKRDRARDRRQQSKLPLDRADEVIGALTHGLLRAGPPATPPRAPA
jgi:hypothetical protein